MKLWVVLALFLLNSFSIASTDSKTDNQAYRYESEAFNYGLSFDHPVSPVSVSYNLQTDWGIAQGVRYVFKLRNFTLEVEVLDYPESTEISGRKLLFLETEYLFDNQGLEADRLRSLSNISVEGVLARLDNDQGQPDTRVIFVDSNRVYRLISVPSERNFDPVVAAQQLESIALTFDLLGENLRYQRHFRKSRAGLLQIAQTQNKAESRDLTDEYLEKLSPLKQAWQKSCDRYKSQPAFSMLITVADSLKALEAMSSPRSAWSRCLERQALVADYPLPAVSPTRVLVDF